MEIVKHYKQLDDDVKENVQIALLAVVFIMSIGLNLVVLLTWLISAVMA